jgi:hypothetical protein
METQKFKSMMKFDGSNFHRFNRMIKDLLTAEKLLHILTITEIPKEPIFEDPTDPSLQELEDKDPFDKYIQEIAKVRLMININLDEKRCTLVEDVEPPNHMMSNLKEAYNSTVPRLQDWRE